MKQITTFLTNEEKNGLICDKEILLTTTFELQKSAKNLTCLTYSWKIY